MSAMIYVCTLCRQNNLADEFADEKEFTNHVHSFHGKKGVTKYRKFKCNLCKYECQQKFYFNNHFKPQDPSDQDTCCNLCFTSKCDWYTHIESVHDGKWSCFECDVNCVDSVGLKNHLRSFHKKNINVETKSKTNASVQKETEADASTEVVVPETPSQPVQPLQPVQPVQLVPPSISSAPPEQQLASIREQEIAMFVQSFQGVNAQTALQLADERFMAVFVQRAQAGQTGNASGQTGNDLSVPDNPPAAHQSSLVSKQPQTNSSPEEEMPLDLSTK